MLDREEHIEQAFFFQTLRDRLAEDIPLQDLLVAVKDEVLADVRLPLAIDFLRTELLHCGALSSAMQRLSHYFTPFQTYIVTEAEDDRSRFDLRIGLDILRSEAAYKSETPTRPGLFLFQFESLCRNRLKYDEGLKAVSADPFYDTPWQQWILMVRRQIGIVDFADMVYVRSQYYASQHREKGLPLDLDESEILFGEREGRIAYANRRKEPLLMLAALQRQLGYPVVPRPSPVREAWDQLPQLSRRLDRLEQRLKLMEDEGRGGIDLAPFLARATENPPS